jgi:hypothetical protein
VSTVIPIRPNLRVRVAWREPGDDDAVSVWSNCPAQGVKWMPHQLTFVDRHGNVQYVTVAAAQLITITPEKSQ